MKKNFTPLLHMIYPVLFFIYLIASQHTSPIGSDTVLWIGVVGAVLFAPLFLIGLVGTLVQLFKKEKKEKDKGEE